MFHEPEDHKPNVNLIIKVLAGLRAEHLNVVRWWIVVRYIQLLSCLWLMSDKVTSLVLLAYRPVCFSEVFVTSVGSHSKPENDKKKADDTIKLLTCITR